MRPVGVRIRGTGRETRRQARLRPQGPPSPSSRRMWSCRSIPRSSPAAKWCSFPDVQTIDLVRHGIRVPSAPPDLKEPAPARARDQAARFGSSPPPEARGNRWLRLRTIRYRSGKARSRNGIARRGRPRGPADVNRQSPTGSEAGADRCSSEKTSLPVARAFRAPSFPYHGHEIPMQGSRSAQGTIWRLQDPEEDRQGEVGIVYEAEQASLQRHVAIKILTPFNWPRTLTYVTRIS